MLVLAKTESPWFVTGLRRDRGTVTVRHALSGEQRTYPQPASERPFEIGDCVRDDKEPADG